jgi:4-alpha-glucanotransferase
MQSFNELINELSEMCGIIPEYWDIFGKKHIASIETKKAILRAMGINADSTEEVAREILRIKALPWTCFIEPVHVVSINNLPLKIPVYMPVDEGQEGLITLSWQVSNKDNPSFPANSGGLSGNSIIIEEQKWINGTRYIKSYIELGGELHGEYNIGYYSINASCRTPETVLNRTSRLIITPDACYVPPELEAGKAWGLCINLYSIRSFKNWGVGDLKDLKEVIKWISGLKGSFVGINPLHAIENKKPFGISPYSPISRLYKNFIYLDIESIQEVKELMADSLWLTAHSEEMKSQVNELRSSDLIDYEKIASLKEKILRYAFEVFYEKQMQNNARNNNTIEKFKQYISEEGEALETFTTFMALSEKFGCYSWQSWPAEFHDPSGTAVQDFKKFSAKEILFYQYIQWLIEEQIKEASLEVKNSGMAVGIYHDLAIGSTGGGSDVWMAQDVIANTVDVGAPPDDFNPKGQNWGFPPVIPLRLNEACYELFIQSIRKNMKHCGALRIDHALGLFRVYWIPQGLTPEHGAYVRYPYEDLLRIIALESIRNRTMVIAEDLGTIGKNAREILDKFKMLSYRLFYFERNYPDPSFTPPEKYLETALCAVTTHDLPTIYGWWTGRDIEVKKQLKIYPDENTMQRDISNRERDKELLLNALLAHGSWLIAHSKNKDHEPLTMSYQPSAMSYELCLAIYEYLAHTPCKLLAVSLDDIIGTLDQQNMPGVTDMYPNWMQKTPLHLEEIISSRWFNNLSEMFKKHNRSLLSKII